MNDLSALLGIDRQTLRRYEMPPGLAGSRVPGPQAMIDIYNWSRGAVRPDSFYDLPELETLNG